MTSAPQPFCRATVTRDGITFNPWRPFLTRPASAAAARSGHLGRDVLVADVHVIRDTADATSEVVIAPLEPTAAVPDFAVDALATWATVVGHARVWLPDRVLDVPTGGALAGTARVTCPTCGTEDSAGGQRFFDKLRRLGHFPPTCRTCGGSLPEWTVERAQLRLFDPETTA